MADKSVDVDVRPDGGRVWAEVSVNGMVVWDCRYASADKTTVLEFDSGNETAQPRTVELPKPSELIGDVHSCWTRFASVSSKDEPVSVTIVWRQLHEGKEVVLKEHNRSGTIKKDKPYEPFRDRFYFWPRSEAIAKALARLSVIALLVGWTPSAWAQDPAPAVALSDVYVDFSVPSLSTFTLLGVENSRVARPGNVRALSVELSNALSAAGEKGIGVEFAPFQLTGFNTLAGYNGLTARLTVSVAAVEAEGGATRFGAGFRWVPFDRADPYDDEALRQSVRDIFRANPTAAIQDAENAFDERLFGFLMRQIPREAAVEVRDLFVFREPQAPLHSATPDVATAIVTGRLAARGVVLGSEDLATLRAFVIEYQLLAAGQSGLVGGRDANVERALVATRKVFRDGHWNAFSLQFGGGLTAGTPGDVGDLATESLAGFAGVSLPLGRTGQLVIHAQAAAALDDSDNQYAFGGRALLGSATRRVSFEALYGANDNRLGDDSYRVLLGGDIRLADGVYLEVATGLNLPDGGDSIFLTMGSLRYGLGTGQRFEIPAR